MGITRLWYLYLRTVVQRKRGEESEYGNWNFKVPKEYTGQTVQIVFDGVMTDTEVLVNDCVAGPIHQGGFYRFSYDITRLLNFGGKNRLEVRVSKHSANKSVNAAVNALCDGHLLADVYLSGAKSGYCLLATVENLKSGELFKEHSFQLTDSATFYRLDTQWENILPWTPESPNLYLLKLKLLNRSGQLLHQHQERIGFRTVEFRPRDGIYVNGVKIVMKGINRHSFHPDGGRTTNKEISVRDALLLKEMNMNAVRSHYPPDTHFLDACDSLGLGVMGTKEAGILLLISISRIMILSNGM